MRRSPVLLGLAVLYGAVVTRADVFNMPAGQTSLQFATVGNPGNAGELSGAGAGGTGPDRICGGVGYTYGVSKFEITAAQYTAFLNAVAATDTYGLYGSGMDDPPDTLSYGCQIFRNGSSGGYTYSVAADWANRPVNYVSWADAARFANWLTNGQPTGAQSLSTTEAGSYALNGATTVTELQGVSREPNARYVIPSEDEWYKAAYYDPYKPGGPGYWRCATSSDSMPSNLVTEPDPGNNANFSPVVGGIGSIGNPYYRTPVGEFENSESPYGTFDQNGNVWEWNESILSSSFRSIRGGSFYESDEDMRAATRLSDNSPLDERGYIGFRVAEVPEPFTIVLLAFAAGARGLLHRGRHPTTFRRRCTSE